MTSAHAVNEVILALYREGRGVPLPRFHGWALEQVRNVIAFDSAWWGNASAAPMEIHGSHLHNCEESMLDAYTAHMSRDFFLPELAARPGVTINSSDLMTRVRLVRTAWYRKVGKRYRMEWLLGTLVVDPISSLCEFLTLWRHDPARPFGELERLTKELLMPHLVEALRSVRLRHFFKGGDGRGRTWALVDDRGHIHDAAPAFVASLRDHWPGWRDARVPTELAKYVTEARSYQTRSLTISIVPSGNLRFLEVQAKTLLDRLTARESEVVERYAAGETYSEIALALALAPATVRNHIARSFQKLAVRNKAQLTLMLTDKWRSGRTVDSGSRS